MVDKCGSWVSITTNSNTLIYAVGDLGQDIIQLVTHTPRLGDVTDGPLAVELRSNDVVHHTTSVTNLERARLNSTNSGRTDDGDTLLLGMM